MWLHIFLITVSWDYWRTKPELYALTILSFYKMLIGLSSWIMAKLSTKVQCNLILPFLNGTTFAINQWFLINLKLLTNHITLCPWNLIRTCVLNWYSIILWVSCPELSISATVAILLSPLAFICRPSILPSVPHSCLVSIRFTFWRPPQEWCFGIEFWNLAEIILIMT